jgi:hypothetical protein
MLTDRLLYLLKAHRSKLAALKSYQIESGIISYNYQIGILHCKAVHKDKSSTTHYKLLQAFYPSVILLVTRYKISICHELVQAHLLPINSY